MYAQKGSEHTCPQEGWSLGWMKQNWEDNQILTLSFSFLDMKILFVYHLALKRSKEEDTLEELGSVKAGCGGEGGMARLSTFTGSFL